MATGSITRSRTCLSLESGCGHLGRNRAALGCRSASGAGEEAFGDGSDRLALDLGLETEQLDRSGLVDPFAAHDEATGLLDPGVVLDREPQRRRGPLLLVCGGQPQGRHQQLRRVTRRSLLASSPHASPSFTGEGTAPRLVRWAMPLRTTCADGR